MCSLFTNDLVRVHRGISSKKAINKYRIQFLMELYISLKWFSLTALFKVFFH